MKHLITVVALLYLVGSLGVAAARGKKDDLDFAIDPGWKVAYRGETKNLYIIEYVPKGDDIENWKELFTYQNGGKSHFDHSPEKMLNALKARGQRVFWRNRMDCNRTK